MSDGLTRPGPACSPAALGRLMPLYAWLDRDGVLIDAGPTLRKLAGPGAIGRPLGEVFTLVHPRSFAQAQDLTAAAALRLVLRGPVATAFKGVAVPLGGVEGGVLLNLSFSYGLREAVRDHGLSDTDFAATDLAFELLYLTEANGAVMAEAKKSSERLRGARAQAMEQALTDPLTGLRNRRGLDRALTRLGDSGQAFGLIHVDLDRFKAINDTLGHAAGDLVLAAVGARLRHVVRDADSLARIGGDEFVVLLPGLAERDMVRRVAERILAALAQPVGRDDGEPPIGVSASLGAVVWDGAAAGPAPRPLSVEQLLEEADRALYRSKDAGRGRVTFAEPAA